jgi:hypothetical protein
MARRSDSGGIRRPPLALWRPPSSPKSAATPHLLPQGPELAHFIDSNFFNIFSRPKVKLDGQQCGQS